MVPNAAGWMTMAGDGYRAVAARAATAGPSALRSPRALGRAEAPVR